MKTEAEFKSIFKKSLRWQGGFAISLAAPMVVGIPDLYVVLPEYLPLLLEAKWLGKITREKFSRKVPFTDMQQHWIKCCDDVLPYSAMGLVGFEHQGDVYAVLVKYGTPHFYQMTNGFLVDCSYVILNKKELAHHRRFDVVELFKNVPIPRMLRPTSELQHPLIPNSGASIGEAINLLTLD